MLIAQKSLLVLVLITFLLMEPSTAITVEVAAGGGREDARGGVGGGVRKAAIVEAAEKFAFGDKLQFRENFAADFNAPA